MHMLGLPVSPGRTRVGCSFPGAALRTFPQGSSSPVPSEGPTPAPPYRRGEGPVRLTHMQCKLTHEPHFSPAMGAGKV